MKLDLNVTTSTDLGAARKNSPESLMVEQVFWSKQILQYFTLKRLSIGLTEEEQRLFNGLQAAVDRAI